MTKRRIEDTVTDLVMPIIEEHEFELVDVEFVKEGANWYLRVYIDKNGGITIDDCQVVSEKLSDKLDEADPIKQSYILEVSSPGLERPLKKDRDFERFKGEEVEVKLFQPVNGKKVFEGELIGLIENQVVIKPIKGDELRFDKNDTAMVRRVLKF
jgi:Uncharacterized protein conserved in bacteria